MVWHSWGASALCLGTEEGVGMAGLLRTVRAWQASARLALRRDQEAEAQVGLETRARSWRPKEVRSEQETGGVGALAGPEKLNGTFADPTRPQPP